MIKKIFLLVLLLFIFTGCHFLSDPLRIGIDSQENSQFMKIARHLDYIDDSFEIVEYKNRGDNIEAFYMGRTDVVYSSLFDSIFFHKKGEKCRIFLMTSTSKKTRALFVGDNTTDLRGKTIAMEADTDEYLELLEYLEKLNLEEKDVKIIFKKKNTAIQEFHKGKVDALYFYKPLDSELLEKGRILEGSESIENLNEVFASHEKNIKKEKKRLKKIVEAWYKVLYIKLNEPEKYLELLNEVNFEVSEEYKQNYLFRDDNERLLKGKEIEGPLNRQIKELNIDIPVGELYTGEIIK